MEYILSLLIGYLFGSIPTAYILLKKAKNIDITEAGSKNMGAMNSYKVSASGYIATAVLIIDALKGFIPVLIVNNLFGDSFSSAALALNAAVFAHCYTPWLKFKGGKGLATAAGGSLLIAPSVLIIWLVFWVISFIFKKHINFANLFATVLTGLISITSAEILNTEKWFTFSPADSNLTFSLTVVIMLLIILSKHGEEINKYFKRDNKSKGENYE